MSLKRGAFRSNAELSLQQTLEKLATSNKKCSNNLTNPTQTRGWRRWSPAPAKDLADRFWPKVDRRGVDECWPWRGARQITGRGVIHFGWKDGKNIRESAPRVAVVIATGQPIPDGQVVCHRCDNPNCVNPSHLFLASQAENVRDSIRKGRYNTFGIQKLNAEQVRAIRAAVASGELQKDVAVRFGIKKNTVSGIVNRKSWAHLTDHPAMDALFERVPHVLLPVIGEVS